MGPVDRVAGLESDHRAPPALGERRPGLGRGQPVVLERGVLRQLDDPDLAGHHVVARSVERLHPGVLDVGGAEHRLRLLLPVPAIDLLHVGHRDGPALGDEGDPRRAPDPLGLLFVHRQGDRDGPHQPVRQVHVLEHRVVVLLPHEPGQRREGPHRQHLQVGKLAASNGHLRKMFGLLGGLGGFVAGQQQVDQCSAMRGDGFARGHSRSLSSGLMEKRQLRVRQA